MMGVEVDETDVAQWLTAMAASGTMEWEVDEEAGIFGHEITLLDFDKGTLDRYRRIADVVQLPDLPNVETAVSLAGSAAQGVIQLYPGDCDYFERVNIKAETREEACRVLADLMRDKALEKFEGPGYQLIEVKFGTWKADVVKDGERIKAGSPVSWSPDEVKAGKMHVFRASGEPWEVEWEYGCLDPGWCKMDWVIAEPEKGRVVNASNMLDVTWEATDGSITPLDGFIDPYFQEVYLEADGVGVADYALGAQVVSDGGGGKLRLAPVGGQLHHCLGVVRAQDDAESPDTKFHVAGTVPRGGALRVTPLATLGLRRGTPQIRSAEGVLYPGGVPPGLPPSGHSPSVSLQQPADGLARPGPLIPPWDAVLVECVRDVLERAGKGVSQGPGLLHGVSLLRVGFQPAHSVVARHHAVAVRSLAAQVLALSALVLHDGQGALGRHFPLPLRDGHEDVGRQAPGRGVGVNGLHHAHQPLGAAHVEKLAQHGTQVLDAAGEAIQLEHNQPVCSVVPHVVERALETGAIQPTA